MQQGGNKIQKQKPHDTLSRHTRWKQLNIRLSVSRNATWKDKTILLSIMQRKLNYKFCTRKLKSMFWKAFGFSMNARYEPISF